MRVPRVLLTVLVFPGWVLQKTLVTFLDKLKVQETAEPPHIHSIMHHQLSSPIFQNMIKYAWYASKLFQEKIAFVNVDETCFALTLTRKNCDCNEVAFI